MNIPEKSVNIRKVIMNMAIVHNLKVISNKLKIVWVLLVKIKYENGLLHCIDKEIFFLLNCIIEILREAALLAYVPILF